MIDLKGLKEPLIIHSGLTGFRGNGVDMRRVPQLVCEAVGHRAAIMPAYTFDFPKTKRFDLKQKPSTGAIAAWFLQGGERTHAPMNSYSTKWVMEILNLKQTTAWGSDSVMEWLYRNNATFVSVGVSTLKSCSYFHYAEELVQVPYRYYKTFVGNLYRGGKLIGPCQETMFVGPKGVAYDFKAMAADKLLEERGLKTRRQYMEIIRVRDIVDVAEECLRKDPYSLCHPKQEGREAVREYVESGKLQDEKEDRFRAGA